MRKQLKSGISLCLCICLLAFCIFPVFAEDAKPSPAEGLHIKNLDDFLAFADGCRLDSYSKDLVVYLDADIDLSGTSFNGIPVFCGEFHGGGHTIQGLSITVNGSVQGLFRYLTKTALVENLKVQGKVVPGGSRSTVGGIVGHNSGTIENCSFDGEAGGIEYIGGIAGTNQVSGVIKGCLISGSIYGNHFVGGVAGENAGLIRECVNLSDIDVNLDQGGVDLANITIDSVLGTTSVSTVTDIGGIAGVSNGVIRSCENRGNVGYKHVGYNIGGIVGRQQGFVVECKNYAPIRGRKEVGGIVGQMEPVSRLEYTSDTLQILQEQMDTLMVLVKQADRNVHNSSENIHNQIVALQDQIEIAKKAIDQLTPNKDDPQLPDKDTLISSLNALTSSLGSIQKLVIGITTSIDEGNTNLTNDIRAITKQMNLINQTLNNASDNIGGSITDSSDQDTDEDTTGKVSQCINYGDVLADLNVGGVVGAVSWENVLDPEDDLQISGQTSMNFQYEVRAVISGCENKATITARKRNAGGIAGLVTLGLVKDCVSTGTLDADIADFIGGIVGNSTGYIRNCSAKCALNGSIYVGGIAGCATFVADCRSMVTIDNGKEKLGAVIGDINVDDVQAKEPFKNNYYLLNDHDYGGIDGVSYAGLAEFLSQDAFFKLPDLKDIFSESTITFIFEDGSITTVSVAVGEALNENDIPVIPKKQGHTGAWEGLDDADLTSVYFDMTFHVSYTPYQVTVESEIHRENGKPILLAEGRFVDMNNFKIEEITDFPAVSGSQEVLEAWRIPDFSNNSKTQLRFACPEGCKPESVQILIRDCDGDWNPVNAEINGSYLVFSVHPTDDAFCAVLQAENYYWILYVAGGVVALLAIILIVVIVKKKSRKKAKKHSAGKEAKETVETTEVVDTADAADTAEASDTSDQK